MSTLSPSRYAAVVGGAALLMATAACGGSSTDDPEPLSAATFQSQANALCKDGFADVAELQQSLPSAASQEEADGIVLEIADRIDALAGAVQALEEPADVHRDVESLLASVVEVSAAMREQKLAFYENLTEDPFADASARALLLKLTDCAG